MNLQIRMAVAVALFALAASFAQAAGAADAGDRDFVAARAAFEQGDRARLDALAPALAGHVLKPYVDYWRLQLALDSAADDDVRAYVNAAVSPPLAGQLRIDWLKSLGRKGLWSRFAAEYPPPAGEDTELACLGIQYRWQRDGDQALAAAKPLWLVGQGTPDACDPLFEALIRRGDLTVADRLERVRLATEAGNPRLARAIAADLPGAARITAQEFARVDADPAKALARGDFRWRETGGRALALYAVERSARTDALAAHAAWQKHRDRVPEAERRRGDARIAFHAARQLLPQAHSWFRVVGDVALADGEHAWRARAALRAGAWADLLAVIDRMPTALARDPTWRYWRARALTATGDAEAAAAVHAELATDSSFYGLLAAEALGRGEEKLAQPRRTAPPVEAEVLAAFGARADVRRVVKLAELEMRTEAQREWVVIVRGADDDALLLAADYARRAGLYDRAINTADRTAARHDYTLRYLMPYRDEFAAAGREHQVDQALLFGIARQESRFAAGIVSSAGAVGLMQLMPATARWVARELKRTDYRPSRIAEVATNTDFGAFYFKYWLERLDAQPALAAAAYNAGPGRAQAWRTGAPLEGAIWVETIPFNETRDYVKKVLANAVYYARELDQRYVALTTRLGTVMPRDAVAVTASPATAASN